MNGARGKTNSELVTLTLVELFVLIIFVLAIQNFSYLKQKDLEIAKLKKEIKESDEEQSDEKKGAGKHSCLVSDTSKTRYLMSTEITDSGIVISEVDQELADVELQWMLSQVDGDTISIGEFREKFLGVFDKSKRLDCRYYVRIRSITTDLEIHKKSVKAITGYFYHRMFD